MYFDISSIHSIVCIGAHPDDIEIGCGGTLLHLLQKNPEISVDWIVMSCQGVRRQEALAAFDAWCRKSERSRIHAFEFPDTLFPSCLADIKKEFHRISESLNPDIVFTHRREDLHQDHRTLAEVTWNTFRDHLILEYEIPKYEGDLGNPNVFVPLSLASVTDKTNLLMRHFLSQRSKPWFDAETFRGLMRLRGLECKSKSGFAEAFHGRKIRLSAG